MPVKTRTIWMLAGLSWGMLVGLAVALETVAFLLGVGWLFVFGDDPWPAAAGPAIMAATIVAGLVPAFLLGWLGRRLGIAFESEGRQRLRARRRGWTVLVLAVVAVIVGVSAAMAGSLRERAERADRRAAEHQLAELLRAVHRLDAPAASVDNAVLRLPITGTRAGAYTLEWTIRESVYDAELDAGSRRLELTDGSVVEHIPLDMSGMRDVYRQTVLGGRGGVLVEEDFEARVRLRPELRPEESARLPDAAIQNLRLGVSGLISEATVPVPVRFQIQ
ncbi:MAG: hypothetical protein OEM96_00715 [Gemmatimonadota bacterium]|nr:hypothetical protein [Gemmatimonadota bacterium]